MPCAMAEGMQSNINMSELSVDWSKVGGANVIGGFSPELLAMCAASEMWQVCSAPALVAPIGVVELNERGMPVYCKPKAPAPQPA